MSNRVTRFLQYLTVATVCGCLFVSCNRDIVFSKYHSVGSDGWERTDTLFFETDPMAHAGKYREELGLRINSHFPFMSMTVIVSQQALPSGLSRKDTVEAILTDKEGTVLGEGVSHYQYLFRLRDMELLKGDTLRVKIWHNMIRQQLAGVTDVGFTLAVN